MILVTLLQRQDKLESAAQLLFVPHLSQCKYTTHISQTVCINLSIKETT